VTVLQLYDKLKPKLGEEEARELLEFVETRVENRVATKACLRQAVSGLRQELQQAVSGLREEIRREFGRLEISLRKEIRGRRTSWLRRSFAFWVGNAAVMSGILFAMLRSFR
jgi:hypothetical protein